MLHRAITACAFVIPALLSISGCECPPDPSVLITHESVTKAISTLESHSDEWFSVTQLEAMIGKPERILGQRDFYSLLDDIDPVLVHLFRVSTESALGGPDVADKCVIWIYAWTHPLEFRAEVVGFLVRRPITEHWSYAYVVYGSRVVFARHIER